MSVHDGGELMGWLWISTTPPLVRLHASTCLAVRPHAWLFRPCPKVSVTRSPFFHDTTDMRS